MPALPSQIHPDASRTYLLPADVPPPWPATPDDPALASSEELRRLFDGRDDAERVAPDDWHPSGSDSEWARLRATDTLGLRRRWFARLVEEGRQ
jgi:hypothetical protein